MLLDISAIGENEIACDVCIVGTGVVGLAVAREFLNGRDDVVVLELGGETDEAQTQALYDSIIVGQSFGGAIAGRARRLGGTTNTWGGQALPMDRIDFEHRDWMPHSGWPIAFETLTPYYERAAVYLRIDGRDFDRNIFDRFSIVPPIDRDALRMPISKWAPRPRLIDVYRRDLETDPSLRVILHANVTSLQPDESGATIRAVEARSLTGQGLRVRARQFILCLGAIETARLILVSDDQKGLGDARSLVGRFLMDHPSGRIGRLHPRSERAAQRLFNLFYAGRRKFSVRLSASERLQRRERILNISCGFNFDLPEGHAIDIARGLKRSLFGRDLPATMALLPRAIRTAPQLASAAWSYLVRRRALAEGATIGLTVNCEQAPDPESRVSLSPERDALGVQKSAIRWMPGEGTGRTAAIFAAEIDRQLRTAGVGTVEPDAWLADWRARWRDNLGDAYHPMGTMRMAHHAADGVVDTSCRMFGMTNVWIAGTAVFPTAGHSNPTLTAIALALRVADAVKQAMRE